MRTFTATTRTLPPTDTEGKRVRVRTSEGTEADYMWDYAHDDTEMHQHAARMAARLGVPEAGTVTVVHTRTYGLGHVFQVTVKG